MWGQVPAVNKANMEERIIPTRVGTRSLATLNRVRDTDHPHACGDKFTSMEQDEFLTGSSPRVWGQEVSPDGAKFVDGIIPTRVGTS